MWNPRWIHTGSDSTVTTPFPQTTRAPQRRLFLFSGLGLDLVSSPVVRTMGVSSLLQPNRGSVLTPQAWRCRQARPEPRDFGPDRADGGQTFMQVPRCKTEFTLLKNSLSQLFLRLRCFCDPLITNLLVCSLAKDHVNVMYSTYSFIQKDSKRCCVHIFCYGIGKLSR